jgi:hypothetical protein
MEINEAPEKIYIPTILVANTVRYKGEGYIEYTRTDAFIEKACDAYCKVCGHYAHTTPTYICRQACDYYKDFKNYIKGE